MDHVVHAVLGHSPAPRSLPTGAESLAVGQRVAPSPSPAVHDPHGYEYGAPFADSAKGTTDAAHGSNKSGAAAATIEAAINVRELNELSAAELSKLTELRQRDQEVRAHEQAHIAAGGGHVVGGARYTHTQGPDGRQYAVSGEVSIDTSKVPGDPHGTIEKAKTVRRAALAPAQPSGQDRNVAAKAQTMEAEARMELVQQRRASGVAAYRTAGTEAYSQAAFTAIA
ncbi:MAG: putative metalloprotease CJM1_0395 family protein [Oceanidesulfovibrio sp.]